MSKLLGIFVLSLLLAGCSQAVVSKVVVRDDRPTLSFVNAPDSATVSVDDVAVGRADAFNGKPTVLYVEPGTHKVAVYSADNKKVFEELLFVDSEHKVINVH